MRFLIEGLVVDAFWQNPPPARSIWEVKDYFNQGLALRVLAKFAKAGLDYHAFKAAVDNARTLVYDERVNVLKAVMGLPYAQWLSLERACKNVGVQTFHSFAGTKPAIDFGPADFVYTAHYAAAIEPETARQCANYRMAPDRNCPPPRRRPSRAHDCSHGRTRDCCAREYRLRGRP